MADAARDLSEQGYSVFPDLLDQHQTRSLRGAIEAFVAALSPPAFYAPEAEALGDLAVVTSSGLAIHRLLDALPEVRPWVLPAHLLETLRGALGPGMKVELVGALVSDATRPFFRWHTHIDGEDEGRRLKARHWPVVTSIDRVLTLLYLDDIDDDTGPLYVLPRRVGDPTAPPGDIDRLEWPGRVELSPRAGTLVALDQCTWHAARSLRRPGLRIVVGCYFTTAGGA